MTPEEFPDLTETLLPITNPDALLASQCTAVPGALSTRAGEAVTLQQSSLLQLQPVAIRRAGFRTDDMLQCTTLAQLPLSRPAFLCTLSLRRLGNGG